MSAYLANTSRHSADAAGAPEGWRARLFEIIFGHETTAGRNFDLALIAVIVVSVLIALLDSVPALHVDLGRGFLIAEWGLTALFTVEYLLRLIIVRRPLRYMRSFFGVVDLLAVLPTYLSLFVPGAQSLIVVRVLRVLRVFRILKLAQYLDEARTLFSAMQRSWRKIFVFLSGILTIVTVFGATMYVIEGPEHGFTSIPAGMYWAIVTVATVGYGDIAPQTDFGRAVTSVLILIGYGIIAVPTGIYAAELSREIRRGTSRVTCARCGLDEHTEGARYCHRCGATLNTAD
ncbi:MAG: ion transporter [Xanthomonadales bacterium]|nr:ion transporter [Xanthomonadales bacterium]